MPPTHPSQADVAAAYRTLIAHETEPKEQDFYRTRLQRLEPTTEPESDDFVTQLAIQQIEGEAAWWRSIDFGRNASRTFDSMTGDSQQAVRTGVERVLAYLQSAGRLIPAGGMALTAEQVEDVRTVANCALQYGNIASREAADRLDSSLPATEPAEECSRGVCSANNGHDGTCAEASGWAEPAEEETKAEELSNVELSCLKMICDLCHKSCRGTVWLPINDMVQGFVDRHYLTRDENGSCKPTISAEKALASSPVVPAPTETGPWQDWPSLDAIPADVRTVWDKAGDEYRRENGGWKFRSPGGKWQQITLPLDDYIDYAPFTTAAVAVWDPELGTRNDWTLNEGAEQ